MLPAEFVTSLDFPQAKALVPASRLLDSLGYDPVRRLAVLEYAHRWGTVACCPNVEDCHRGQIERLLPVAPDAQWNLEKFSGTWELGPERTANENILASA